MADHTHGAGPIEPQYLEKMNRLAHAIDELFNPTGERDNGFVLLVFPFSEDGDAHTPGRVNYISNARRKDVVNLLDEQLENFRRQAAAENP